MRVKSITPEGKERAFCWMCDWNSKSKDARKRAEAHARTNKHRTLYYVTIETEFDGQNE